jgi:hypothetical protein
LQAARKLEVCELGGSVGVLVAELRGTVGMAVDGGSAAVQVKSAISSIMATAQPIIVGRLAPKTPLQESSARCAPFNAGRISRRDGAAQTPHHALQLAQLSRPPPMQHPSRVAQRL